MVKTYKGKVYDYSKGSIINKILNLSQNYTREQLMSLKVVEIQKIFKNLKAGLMMKQSGNSVNYNSKVAVAQRREAGNMFRIQGQFARASGRAAAIGTLVSTGLNFAGSSAGKSLLGGSKPAGSFDGASSMTQYQSNPTGYSGSF